MLGVLFTQQLARYIVVCCGQGTNASLDMDLLLLYQFDHSRGRSSDGKGEVLEDDMYHPLFCHIDLLVLFFHIYLLFFLFFTHMVFSMCSLHIWDIPYVLFTYGIFHMFSSHMVSSLCSPHIWDLPSSCSPLFISIRACYI